MSLITPDLSGIVDGQVGDAVDWTTPLNTMINDYNGGITNDNISASAAIAFSKLATDAWTSYTTTWSSSGTAPAIGNGTLSAKYTKIGRIVILVISMEAGASTTFGSSNPWTFSLPVTAKYTAPYEVGSAIYLDNGTRYYNGECRIDSANTVSCFYDGAGQVDVDSPHTWASGDSLRLTITYESAA